MEKEKRTEEAIQVFRKMLVEEFGIKSTEQSHRRRNKCCLRYNF